MTTGIRHVGAAAWQACQQLQIVKLPPSVISLAEGAFLGCYVLREVVAPGCIRYGPRVFAECCSLSRVGASHGTEDNSVLAPGAQLGKYAFESCLTLTTITFDMDHTSKPRDCLKGRSAVHALNSSACRVTSTISGRVPVKIVKALWRSTLWTQRSSPPFFHICPLCRFKQHMAPATTHANWQRRFSELCCTARSCHPDGAQGYRQPCILWV